PFSIALCHTSAATTDTYSRSLHDALPICPGHDLGGGRHRGGVGQVDQPPLEDPEQPDQQHDHRENHEGGADSGQVHGASPPQGGDRKSTRLNSSHVKISYAVFCLKKKIDT